jgi:hypothetical protein
VINTLVYDDAELLMTIKSFIAQVLPASSTEIEYKGGGEEEECCKLLGQLGEFKS